MYSVLRAGPRIILYSHDTMGLGHTRRNMLIARALAAPPIGASVLMICGIRESGAFAAPPGVDFLTLPAYTKHVDGSYASRTLAIEGAALASLRAEAIKAAVTQFSPDLFIVDNVPGGALSELMPTLNELARSGGRQCVLGLRDVLDEPRVVHRQWQQQNSLEIIRQCYRSVWIYGDPAVYDTVDEYAFPPDIRAKTRFTGYLDPILPSPPALSTLVGGGGSRPPDDLVLCLVGGGQDGLKLAWNFAMAKLPAGSRGMIVTGPFMPEPARAALRQQAAEDPNLIIREFVTDPLPLIRDARSVVAMGGYNTVIELLSLEKRTLLVPRSKPRAEQLIRAERLKGLGLLDFIRQEELTGEGISDWLSRGEPPGRMRHPVDFRGLERIVSLAAELTGCATPLPTIPFPFSPEEPLRAAV